MKEVYPFSITKHQDSKYFYVRFKNTTTGKYQNWISTKQTSKEQAIKTALKWYYSDTIPKKKEQLKVIQFDLRYTVKNHDLTAKDAEFLIQELQKRGLVKSAIFTGSKQDIDMIEFLLNFWDYDKSPYIREKLRKNHGIHRSYCIKQYGAIKKHWQPLFKGRLLGEFTHQDLETFITHFEDTNLSVRSKNATIQAGTIALSWAYNKELIDKDVTKGIVWYSGTPKERQILSPELVQALFLVDWNNDRCKLANMLAMCTGLRIGEILGLRMQDLGQECLYIRHSWSLFDRLKTTKNNECRIVEVPFPNIMHALKALAESNPHKESMDGFVFYATIAGQPLESKTFLYELRKALQKIGMSEATAKTYTFHAWRHYFTAYMKDKINEKVLRQQTGHKTAIMLDHYGNHEIQGERKLLRLAQVKTFGEFLPEDINTTFQTGIVKQHNRG